MRRHRGIALAVLAVALLAPGSASAATSCTVSGSTLSVSGDALADDVALGRGGEQIIVSAFPEPGLEPTQVACSGPAPTVTSIDTIAVANTSRFDSFDVFLELSGGPFAPGLTPEPDASSEIEFSFSRVPEVVVNGSDGPDQYAFGVLGDASGVNLNAGAEGAAPDVDIVSPAYRRDPKRKRLTSTDWEVHAQGGDDVVDASGGGAFTSGAPADFRVSGQQGDDRILGTSRGSELVGGPGDDLMIGGRKPDAIFGGKGDGRDTLVGRAGEDLLFSGDGRDTIDGGRDSDLIWSGRGVDRVRCGPQPDAVEINSGRKDHRHGCELLISFEGLFS
jgi:hypothetical protein